MNDQRLATAVAMAGKEMCGEFVRPSTANAIIADVLQATEGDLRLRLRSAMIANLGIDPIKSSSHIEVAMRTFEDVIGNFRDYTSSHIDENVALPKS